MATPIEAKREWLARWCFGMTASRPSLRELSDKDVALLYKAITAIEDRANVISAARQHRP